MNAELQQLIEEQRRDDTYRVWTFRSLDAYPSGADIRETPRRLLAHDDRHGQLSLYTNQGCRCEKCRAAAATWKREWRRRTQAGPCVDGCGRTAITGGRCRSCATSAGRKAYWEKRRVEFRAA